jgi:glycosyltransferase involved in cell wall biosynthesis
LLRDLHADFFLAPYNTAPLAIPSRTRLILVLHDLILLEHIDAPNLKQLLENQYRRFLIPKAVSRSHVVITVSSFVKGEIEKRFPKAEVRIIPNTVAPSWFVSKATVAEDRGNYVLAVTSSAPHKNAARAMEGYARLVCGMGRSSVLRLRLVGLAGAPLGEFVNLAAKLQIADLVDFEPFVTETQLQNLYRRSRAVLVPSLKEGFGIPVLEAMASGTPVIASNATSLPEVGGLAAAYFEPRDPSALATVLSQVLGSSDRQQRMIELGFTQAKQFHPNIVNRQIHAFWDALLTG